MAEIHKNGRRKRRKKRLPFPSHSGFIALLRLFIYSSLVHLSVDLPPRWILEGFLEVSSHFRPFLKLFSSFWPAIAQDFWGFLKIRSLNWLIHFNWLSVDWIIIDDYLTNGSIEIDNWQPIGWKVNLLLLPPAPPPPPVLYLCGTSQEAEEEEEEVEKSPKIQKIGQTTRSNFDYFSFSFFFLWFSPLFLRYLFIYLFIYFVPPPILQPRQVEHRLGWPIVH